MTQPGAVAGFGHRSRIEFDSRIAEIARRLKLLRAQVGPDQSLLNAIIEQTDPFAINGLAVVNNINSITITWDGVGATDLLHYDVQIASDPLFSDAVIRSTTQVFYTWLEGTPGTTYWMRVRAVLISGTGAFSLALNTTTGLILTVDLAALATKNYVFTQVGDGSTWYPAIAKMFNEERFRLVASYLQTPVVTGGSGFSGHALPPGLDDRYDYVIPISSVIATVGGAVIARTSMEILFYTDRPGGGETQTAAMQIEIVRDGNVVFRTGRMSTWQIWQSGGSTHHAFLTGMGLVDLPPVGSHTYESRLSLFELTGADVDGGSAKIQVHQATTVLVELKR